MSLIDFDRVLTTGAGGMVGAYIDFGLRPSSKELDITVEEDVLAYFKKHQPSAVIHLAAAADMARCENEPSYAYDINVRGTYNIVSAAKELDIPVVTVSSSRVFSGDKDTPYKESDIPNPHTHYGTTKYIAEMITEKMINNHLIVRTAWVFGGGPEKDNKFYGKVINQIQDNSSEINALGDVKGSPTYAKDLVETIKQILADNRKGTYHVTNTGVASRFDIAELIALEFGNTVSVKSVDRSYFPGAESLPDNEAVESVVYQLRPWKEALREYLDTEWKV